MDSGRPPPIHLTVRLELPEKDPRSFEYDFEQSVITLGRDPGNDIQVPLTTVSRHHARIFYERGDYFLEDLGSTHGTVHNDRPLAKGERRLLRAGDRMTVVSFHILFETSSGTMLDRQPGERTEQLARRMVQEVLQSLGGEDSESPSLRVMTGPDEGRRYDLAEDSAEVVIGRSPDCDITLDDHNISRRHCLVKRSWHGFTVQDLGSRNGLTVNGKELDGPRMLRDGDELDVGGIKLTFIDPPSRLLDRMGGLEDEIDPAGQGGTASIDGEEDEAEVAPDEEPAPEEEAYPGDLDDLEPPLGDDAPPPFEPEADYDAEGPSELDEESRKVMARLERSPFLDIIILVAVGALFVIAAGVGAFVLMQS